ncbi:unnamed protein product [Pieris macdunnoughi]|uniref:Uncharacterized protein n=1 Tax=Pieris macdunnoughi TaxID=345717 RepID=A0A821VZD2_9NEOP|nr:unnamed protein product [Pieris macdunnoughi]
MIIYQWHRLVYTL